MMVNLRSYKQKLRHNRRSFRSFLNRIEKNPPKKLHSLMAQTDKEVWEETDCLSCGNCCKKMTPTFTDADMKRIAGHFNMTVAAFKDKWLTFEKRDGDWQNKKQPCQFLNLTDNKCSIYPIRPADCAEFPHFTKKKPEDYIHVYKQNIDYCPATYKMVEKLQVLLNSR
jgi:uncharacterized protein